MIQRRSWPLRSDECGGSGGLGSRDVQGAHSAETELLGATHRQPYQCPGDRRRLRRCGKECVVERDLDQPPVEGWKVGFGRTSRRTNSLVTNSRCASLRMARAGAAIALAPRYPFNQHTRIHIRADHMSDSG